MSWLMLFVASVLVLIALLFFLIQGTRREVKPTTAVVYYNMWTGRTYCALPGTTFEVVPGIHRILAEEVSLKNEAENPKNVNLITGDGIELEVDYVLRRFQVGTPGMPEFEKLGGYDRELLKTSAIQAVTAIDYKIRRDKVLTRIVAILQESLERRALNELFTGINIAKSTLGKVNKTEMKKIEDEVNQSLGLDQATTEWGFWVEIDLEDYNLPKVIRQAREQKSSAKIAGTALKEKAKAAGVDPRWLVIGEALSNLFGHKATKEEAP